MNTAIPPNASWPDFALNRAIAESSRVAAANRASIVFGGNLAPVNPAGLTAPTSAVVAVIALTPKVSGRFYFNFTLGYTDSAADTVTAAVSVGPAVTIAGGTLLNNITWESSAITIAGFVSAQTPDIYGATFATGNLTQTMKLSGLTAVTPVGTPALIVLSVSAAHNLSGMSLVASAFELA